MRKDLSRVRLTFALCFPDVYEVGMSHVGLRILYHVLNSRPEIAAERVFMPWVDFEQLLRKTATPLFSLENKLPLRSFDIVGFSLQYELTYTNVLAMLELGGVPVLAAERGKDDPLVIAGGPCATNPEPLAPFLDAVVLGDGEEVALDLAQATIEGRERGLPRRDLLRRLADIPGVYVPSLYRAHYDGSRFAGVEPLDGAPQRVVRRIVLDLDAAPFPSAPVVPFVETIHDRVALEIARGCTQGCRFCHAGATYRPVRERSRGVLRRLARESVDSTGYDEISLLSLSTTDYSEIEALCDDLLEEFSGEQVSISLPSLRVDAFSVGLCERVSRVRRSGITLAAEAGTQRLRDVINKRVTDDDIERAACAAFDAGYQQIKLYFMIGLPTEREEDVLGIAETVRRIVRLGRERGAGRRGVIANVSVASFVPKPHTPFQWEAQLPPEELERRQRLVIDNLRTRAVKLSWHDVQQSRLEAIFARGDRRLAQVLLEARRLGLRLDGWTDLFNPGAWEEAFARAGVAPEEYLGEREEDQPLPWDHLSCGVSKDFLLRERRRALAGEPTPDCRRGPCVACGVDCEHLRRADL